MTQCHTLKLALTSNPGIIRRHAQRLTNGSIVITSGFHPMRTVKVPRRFWLDCKICVVHSTHFHKITEFNRRPRWTYAASLCQVATSHVLAWISDGRRLSSSVFRIRPPINLKNRHRCLTRSTKFDLPGQSKPDWILTALNYTICALRPVRRFIPMTRDTTHLTSSRTQTIT